MTATINVHPPHFILVDFVTRFLNPLIVLFMRVLYLCKSVSHHQDSILVCTYNSSFLERCHKSGCSYDDCFCIHRGLKKISVMGASSWDSVISWSQNVHKTNMLSPIDLSLLITCARTNSVSDNGFFIPRLTILLCFRRSFRVWPLVLVFVVIVALLTCVAVVSF